MTTGFKWLEAWKQQFFYGKLNSIQFWFLRLVLQVGPGAPKASLLWDFGLLDMGLRVWIEKVMLALHIKRMAEGTLARMIFVEQSANN